MGWTVASISGDSSAESSFRELDDVFLQTQTRIWLGELLHTRLDDQLHISELLVDGELLFEVSKAICKMLLAMHLEPRPVKAHKYKPFGSRKKSGRYTPYSNVDSFLKVCKILGMNGIDLFSPSDVVEKRDIRKVCICIRSFSKKARSKQLNVPDFDMVTSMVAMPTDMVGCIRRSLELSQCSSSASVSDCPSRNSRSKRSQKMQAEACGSNYDSYAEGSYDMESDYTGVHSRSSSTDYSFDTTALIISDLENSPGASSVVNTYTFAQNKSQPDAQDQEFDENEQSLCKSEDLASLTSLHSRDVKYDHQLDSMSCTCIDSRLKLRNGASHLNDRIRHNLGMRNDALGTELSFDDKTEKGIQELADGDCIVCSTDNSVRVPFDGEGNMCNLYVDTDSHGSSSVQSICHIGFGRKFSDDIEDVEVSSAASMGSVSSRMFKLNYDDHFDDLRTDRVDFTELQNNEVDNLDKNEAIFEMLMQSSCLDTNMAQIEIKCETFGFCTEPLSSCSGDQQPYATEYEYHVDSLNSEIGISLTDSSNALCLKGMNFVDEDNDEVIGAPIVKSDANLKQHPSNRLLATSPSNVIDSCEDSSASCNIFVVKGSERCHSVVKGMNAGSGLQDPDTTIHDIQQFQSKPTVEKHHQSILEASDNVNEKGSQAFADQNEDAPYCAGCTDEGEKYQNFAEEISDGRTRVGQGKPSKRPLLKTVVRGTAFLGVLLLLLHFRKRGRQKTGEKSKKFWQFQKSNGVEFSSKKGQKSARVNGIYPREKLKFGN